MEYIQEYQQLPRQRLCGVDAELTVRSAAHKADGGPIPGPLVAGWQRDNLANQMREFPQPAPRVWASLIHGLDRQSCVQRASLSSTRQFGVRTSSLSSLHPLAVFVAAASFVSDVDVHPLISWLAEGTTPCHDEHEVRSTEYGIPAGQRNTMEDEPQMPALRCALQGVR